MSKQTVRIGLIGCGNRLRGVLDLLLKQDKRLTVVAAYDPDSGSIAALKKLVGEGVKTYSDYHQLVQSPEVDWVMVGSPNRFHSQQAVAALDAGKDVFCEKPLATNIDDCLAVRDAVKRTGRTFFFGLVLRYSPHYQTVRKAIEDGQIGQLISFEFNETLTFSHGGYIFGNWRRATNDAGTHVLEKTCHDLDLANWMVGSLPIRVASFGGRRFFVPDNAGIADQIGPDADGRPAFQQWLDPHGVDPFSAGADINDHQVAILEYANGVRATFHTNVVTAINERRFYLCGNRGSLRADAVSGEIKLKQLGHDTPTQNLQTMDADGHAGGDQVMAKHLADTMLNGAPPLAGIDEALRSAIVAFAIDQAASGLGVVNVKPLWQKVGIEVSGL